MRPRWILILSLLTVCLLLLATVPDFTIESSSTQDKSSRTAIVLNPDQYIYGSRSSTAIAKILTQQGYIVRYEENTDVDLNFIRTNLTADVLYMNTHAGHYDMNADGEADTVVIATGESWTDETQDKYAFDYSQGFIVEGVVGNSSFIAFTPAFIEYYYNKSLPGSLVYMATCEAAADSSMADGFLSGGATVYVGWTSSTTFWTNGITSVVAFRLLAHQLPIDTICHLIRAGGFYNWIFHSRLMYYGDGGYRLPQDSWLLG